MIYVYDVFNGALWSEASDLSQVAPDEVLAARGLAKTGDLPATNDGLHVWDAANRTIRALNQDELAAIAAEPRPVTPDQFIFLFTPEETDAIRASSDLVVKQLLYAMEHAPEIDLNSQRVKDGVAYLFTAGLIGAGRSDAILAGDAP